VITSLTSITSELAKVQLNIYQKEVGAGCTNLVIMISIKKIEIL
jgi:hypothetical protein